MKLKRMVSALLATVLTVSAFSIQVYAGNAILGSSVTVRSGASILSGSIGSLSANNEIEVIGKEMSWYKIKYGNGTGYISESAVSDMDPYIKRQYDPVKANYTKLAGYTTYFSTSDKNRNHNIELGAYKNSIIVAPGQTFSFNRNTGNSNLESNGWKPAGVIVNKQRATGVGGGICQTSSTTYSAVKQISGLTVVERNPHSIPVGYVPVSGEAMVNYGTSDFKFRNDLSYSVFVDARINHAAGSITMSIYKIDPNLPEYEPEIMVNVKEQTEKLIKEKISALASDPESIKNDIGINKAMTITGESLSFIVDDVDGDENYDLVVRASVTIDGSEYIFTIIYGYQFGRLSAKTFNQRSSIEGDVGYFRKNGTNEVSWNVLDYSTFEVYKIQKGFVFSKVADLATFKAGYESLATNQRLVSQESITEMTNLGTIKLPIVAKVVIDGEEIRYNVPPQNIDDRIYIEMRSLFEILGYSVTYDNETKRTAIFNDNVKYELLSGVDSQSIIKETADSTDEISLEIPLKLVNNRTMFPLRLAGELLGYEVNWDQGKYTASLTYTGETQVNSVPVDEISETPDEISDETEDEENNSEVTDTNNVVIDGANDPLNENSIPSNLDQNGEPISPFINEDEENDSTNLEILN